MAWFVDLDKGTLSSFAELVETFCNHWDSGHRDKWIPHVKRAKDLFSKEAQSKDQVKETIIQGLTNDILSMIDKSSQANEYYDGPIYDDPEVLVEEAKEQKDRMIPPFQHTKTPYDILDLWEHDDGNYEDDGY